MASASDRRKSSGGNEEGGANWMDTYGDLVTLLLTFFVLLFAFSSIDVAKWEALVGSFTGISVMSVTPLTPEVVLQRPVNEFEPRNEAQQEQQQQQELDEDTLALAQEAADLMAEAEAKMWKMYEHMIAYVEEHGIEAEIVLVEDEYTVKMIINELVFFRTAESYLLPEAFPILDSVIEMYREAEEQELYETLRVEGHADNRPINTSRYPSNWDLSVDRAVNVARYIMKTRLIDPMRLACVGYGEERPLVPNDSPENLARNRRVEFLAETAPPIFKSMLRDREVWPSAID